MTQGRLKELCHRESADDMRISVKILLQLVVWLVLKTLLLNNPNPNHIHRMHVTDDCRLDCQDALERSASRDA